MPSVPCPRCRSPLPLTEPATGLFTPCPGCGVPARLEVFPALLRPVAAGASAESILVESEASCFYHPQKRAAIHCQSCGRFLCALCDVELNGQHLCPPCLEAGQRKGTMGELVNRRTLYDSAALSLALLPLLVWPLTVITAPATIVLALYGWSKPGSLVPRTKVRFVLAILIGLLEMFGWGLLVYSIITST
jgi:hypothetical protein